MIYSTADQHTIFFNFYILFHWNTCNFTVELKFLISVVIAFYQRFCLHNMWDVIWKTVDEDAYTIRKGKVDAKLLTSTSVKVGSEYIYLYLFIDFILGDNSHFLQRLLCGWVLRYTSCGGNRSTGLQTHTLSCRP